MQKAQRTQTNLEVVEAEEEEDEGEVVEEVGVGVEEAENQAGMRKRQQVL